MQISVRTKIYGSFSVLVVLFVINGIIAIITLNSMRDLSGYISRVIDPSLHSLISFRKIMLESRSYATNWVFLRFREEDKELLVKLQNHNYPEVKLTISKYALKWRSKQWQDSLNKLFMGFEELLVIEKSIMTNLNDFTDYDDPVVKLEAERKIEEEVLPRTSALMKSLNNIYSFQLKVAAQESLKVERSSMKLRYVIAILAVTIICAGLFLSLYMARIIIEPINKIRLIINDLGYGIISRVNYKTGQDEIGEMISSVNNLSEKLQRTASFATEIGNRNFSSYFEPLGPGDVLGKALLAMRENIKSSDEKFNQAQHIAHLGSLERDMATGKVYLSDEMYNILDIDPASFDCSFENITRLIQPEDQEEFKKYRDKYLQNSQLNNYECKIVTPKGIAKNIFVQSKVIVNPQGSISRIIGIVQDITDRKLAEKKLNEERELFRLVIENIPDQIYMKDREGRFMLCNTPVAINAGCSSQADMLGKTDFDFLPGEIARQCFIDEQKVIQSGIPLINHEEQMTDKVTGKLRWGLSTKFPLKNINGDMIGLIGINHDITKRKIVEKELEDANRELSILFNSIDEIFFSVNMVTLKVIQISVTCEELYGYTQSEFLANHRLWFDIIHPDDKQVIAEEDSIMLRGEQVNNCYRIIRKDKDIRWVETNITPTLDGGGKLIRVDGVTRDITERKKSEEALKKSEAFNKGVLASLSSHIAVINDEGSVIAVNKAWEDYSIANGATDLACTGKGSNYFDVCKKAIAEGDEIAKQTLAGIFGVLKKEINIFELEYPCYSPTAKSWFLLHVMNFESDTPKVVLTHQDITERKLGEEKLFESEKYNRNLFNQSTVGLALSCMNGKLQDVNQAYAEIIGLTIEECKRLSYYDITPEKYKAKESEQLLQLELTGKYGPYEKEYIHKDGHLVPVTLSGTILEIDNTKYILSSAEDITARKKADEALRLTQFTVENTAHAIYWIKADGSFYKLNHAAAQMLGYTFEELMQLNVSGIDPHYDKKTWAGFWEDLRHKKSITLFTSHCKKDGTCIDVQIDTHYLSFDDQEMSCAFVYDITERKQAETLLKNSEERYRLIVETSQEGIWMTDENRKTNFVNKRMCEMLGYSADEMLGRELFYFMDEAGKNISTATLERGKEGGSEYLDFRFITKAGSVLWAYVVTSPVLDDEGKYIGALAMITDITKRKHDEDLLQKSGVSLALNNLELEQKNKELEQFAYVASHDLQEPLRTTTSFVEIFKQQYFGKLDSRADKYLNYITQASERMGVLIKDLLDFSRIGHNKDPEEVDCNSILKDVIADIDKAIKDADAKIISERLPVIDGYATELKQLFQNLLMNSIKFRKKNVPPQINIAAQKKNNYWQFAFTDNGIGIEQQYNERIFIIFQRLHTRTEYQGSGIGLSHCKKIVELHHGKIWVESVPKAGSTFYFTIHSPKQKLNERKIKLHNAD